MKPWLRQEMFKGQPTLVFTCPTCGAEWYKKGIVAKSVVTTPSIIRELPICPCDGIEPERKA